MIKPQQQQQEPEHSFDLQFLPIKELALSAPTDRQINTEICRQVHIYVYLRLLHTNLQRMHNNFSGVTHSPTNGVRPITHKWVKRSINIQVLTPVCGQKPVIPLQADRSPIQTILV